MTRRGAPKLAEFLKILRAATRQQEQLAKTIHEQRQPQRIYSRADFHCAPESVQ